MHENTAQKYKKITIFTSSGSIKRLRGIIKCRKLNHITELGTRSSASLY